MPRPKQPSANWPQLWSQPPILSPRPCGNSTTPGLRNPEPTDATDAGGSLTRGFTAYSTTWPLRILTCTRITHNTIYGLLLSSMSPRPDSASTPPPRSKDYGDRHYWHQPGGMPRV